jgi:hypothetical protein
MLSVALFVERPWAWVHSAYARLVDDSNFQVVGDANLTREANVRGKFGFDSEAIAFEFAHRAGIAFQDFDAAGRATSVAAAAVKNIDTGVFEGQDEFFAGRRLGFDKTSGGFSLDLRHV